MTTLASVFAPAVLAQLSPPFPSPALWPSEPGTPLAGLAPEARRQDDVKTLTRLVSFVLRPGLLPQGTDLLAAIHDPGDGLPYVFRWQDGGVRVALAPRSLDQKKAYPVVLLEAPPAGGAAWAARLAPALAALAPAWRGLVVAAASDPELEPRDGCLTCWANASAVDPSLHLLYVASDGAHTVLALAPRVHRSQRA